MKTQVLFVQGGGKNAHEEDQKLAASLQAALGSDYNVLFPRMPKESDPEYWRWKTDIARRIARLGVADLVLVRSHSLVVKTHLLILVALLIVSSGVLLAAAVVYGSFAISGRLRSRAI